MEEMYSVIFISLFLLTIASCADCKREKKDILEKRNSNNEKIRELKNELKEALLLVKDDDELKDMKKRLSILKSEKEFRKGEVGQHINKEMAALEKKIKPIEKAKKNIKNIKTILKKTEDENARLQERYDIQKYLQCQ